MTHRIIPVEATEGRFTEHELYYLRSIYGNLSALRAMIDDGPSLGGEVLSDNMDWLDGFIHSTPAAAPPFILTDEHVERAADAIAALDLEWHPSRSEQLDQARAALTAFTESLNK